MASSKGEKKSFFFVGFVLVVFVKYRKRVDGKGLQEDGIREFGSRKKKKWWVENDAGW